MSQERSNSKEGAGAGGGAGQKAAPARVSIFKGMGKELMLTLREGDMMRSQGMIMGGVEMDFRDYWGRTPLHVATTKSAIGVVDLMIKMNVDPNPVDRYSEITPLHLAAGNNNILIVKKLLAAKANPNLCGVEGDTPLCRASGRGYHKVIKALCDHKQTDVDVLDRDENEYMRWEKENEGKIIQSQMRRERGRARNRDGSSARRHGGHPSRSPSRSPNTRGGSPQTDNATYFKRERRPPMSPLLKAVKRNAKLDIIKMLLKANLMIEREDEKKNRPIHCAAHYGNATNCRMLLDAKADVKVKNHLGRTPLHFAARSGHPRCIKMLLEAKADVNAEDIYMQTPMSVACDTQMRKMLQDAGGKENPEALTAPQPVSNPVTRSASPSRSPSPETHREKSPGKGNVAAKHGGA